MLDGRQLDKTTTQTSTQPLYPAIQNRTPQAQDDAPTEGAIADYLQARAATYVVPPRDTPGGPGTPGQVESITEDPAYLYPQFTPPISPGGPAQAHPTTASPAQEEQEEYKQDTRLMRMVRDSFQELPIEPPKPAISWKRWCLNKSIALTVSLFPALNNAAAQIPGTKAADMSSEWFSALDGSEKFWVSSRFLGALGANLYVASDYTGQARDAVNNASSEDIGYLTYAIAATIAPWIIANDGYQPFGAAAASVFATAASTIILLTRYIAIRRIAHSLYDYLYNPDYQFAQELLLSLSNKLFEEYQAEVNQIILRLCIRYELQSACRVVDLDQVRHLNFLITREGVLDKLLALDEKAMTDLGKLQAILYPGKDNLSGFEKIQVEKIASFIQRGKENYLNSNYNDILVEQIFKVLDHFVQLKLEARQSTSPSAQEEGRAHPESPIEGQPHEEKESCPTPKNILKQGTSLAFFICVGLLVVLGTGAAEVVFAERTGKGLRKLLAEGLAERVAAFVFALPNALLYGLTLKDITLLIRNALSQVNDDPSLQNIAKVLVVSAAAILSGKSMQTSSIAAFEDPDRIIQGISLEKIATDAERTSAEVITKLVEVGVVSVNGGSLLKMTFPGTPGIKGFKEHLRRNGFKNKGYPGQNFNKAYLPTLFPQPVETGKQDDSGYGSFHKQTFPMT